MKDHRRIDERSLALAEAVAACLRADPSLLARAQATLDRWMQTSAPGVRPALEEWRNALQGSPEEVMALLTGRDERATRLRQSNPFAGVLPPRERTAILREFETHEAPPT